MLITSNPGEDGGWGTGNGERGTGNREKKIVKEFQDLAIPQGTYKSNFQRQLAQMIVKRNQVNLLIFDADNEEIKQWIN